MTMIHDGLLRDVIINRPRQEACFTRRIASIIKYLLPSKKKKSRVIVVSDEESSPISCDEKESSEDPQPFEMGSDTCALCEGLAKVCIYLYMKFY